MGRPDSGSHAPVVASSLIERAYESQTQYLWSPQWDSNPH